MNARVLTATEAHVRDLLEGEGSGHDWWHVHRVRNLALTIGKEEGADLFVVELAALLHDIADWKFHGGDTSVGPTKAREWLEKQGVDERMINHVCDIIAHISYKGAGVATPMSTIEGKAVQDADRIEALGAIGIARTFAYGGHKNRPMHDPETQPTLHTSFEQYSAHPGKGGTTINHFYEKLLLLKDRMNTATGKRIAEERTAFMQAYLDRFFKEWDGRL